MPLDFTRATQLFMGSEAELAVALGIPVTALRAFRANPRTVPSEIAARLAAVLIERGQGMVRVGEMLRELANGNGE
ncbi:MAG: hypothetical protein L0271_19835 [Gemmatimonadetes bacterium]|nr:hypothetical protein [Gemmatimonadota bacterium]